MWSRVLNQQEGQRDKTILMAAMLKRNASHAGTWYSASSTDVASRRRIVNSEMSFGSPFFAFLEPKLSQELDSWLAEAGQPSMSPPVKAIIAPHAGYAYSGSTAAYAYKEVRSKL